jgi:hypothetical protein
MLHKDYEFSCAKKKRKKKETQGAWCQDELLGSKPPDIK